MRKAGRGVFCPKCHKEHFSADTYMDEYISCECGLDFYAFSDSGLIIMMSPREAGYEPIARAMRRFVVSTGRCQDIDPRLLEGGSEVVMQERDLDDQLAEILEEYQLAAFGECYITKEVIDSVCQRFERNVDVVMKKQKDGIDVSDLRRPDRVITKSPSQRTRILSYAQRLGSLPDAGEIIRDGGIMRRQQTRAAL